MSAVPPESDPTPARSGRTRRAVLDATAALMAEGGLAAATVDAIRDRSGVSKTTVYKHWPNRLCVAVDAFAERLAAHALPDTGNARDDFCEQIRRVSTFYSSPVGGAFAQLLAATTQEPVAREWLHARFLDSRRHGTHALWNRAISRGEVPPDIDPDLVMDLMFGPVMWRLVSGRPPLTGAQVEVVVDSVLTGLWRSTRSVDSNHAPISRL